MKDGEKRTEANQLYTKAHVAQYKDKDLPAALALYEAIVMEHPTAPEAGYSRSQIHAIATNVVPKQELMDIHLKLALAHLEQQP